MRVDLKASEINRAVDWFEAAFGDGDDDLKLIFLEGETDLHSVARRIHEIIARDTETLVGIKDRKDSIAEREARIKARVAAGKEAIGKLLRAAHLKKLELPEVTYSVRDGKPKLEIVSADAVPADFQRATYAPDKIAINEAFEDSDELPNWLTRLPAKDIVTGRVK